MKTRYSCCSCAIHNNFAFLNFAICQFTRVNDSCKTNDCSSVLIIMKDRNIHDSFQSPLNIETIGPFDIFKIDPSICSSKQLNRVNKFIDILSLDVQINAIYISKLFHKNCFAFHHRFWSKSPKISKSKNRCSIWYDTYWVWFSCVLVSESLIFLNSLANLHNSRSNCIILILNPLKRLWRPNLILTWDGFSMIQISFMWCDSCLFLLFIRLNMLWEFSIKEAIIISFHLIN